jgi:UDP-N-acetylmuramate dehydrogenase
MNQNIFTNYQGVLKTNYNLAHLTWLKVGGNADFFYKPDSIQDLQNFMAQIPADMDVNIIGAGSNLLIRDSRVPGVVIKLGSQFNYINLQKDFLMVGASTLNYNLAHFAYENLITGLEFLLGIPGTIGGGVAMNAGSYGSEFKDIIASVVVINRKGQLVELSNQEIGFAYRSNSLDQGHIFVEAKIHAQKCKQEKIKVLMDNISLKRKVSQPINLKTAGSTFANPEGQKAWRLIDQVGMRGYAVNDAQISNLHCNFLINAGNATALDLENLAEIVRSKVLSDTGIELQWEIKRLGLKK